eukprot:7385893-Prymnesium_polylepis.1
MGASGVSQVFVEPQMPGPAGLTCGRRDVATDGHGSMCSVMLGRLSDHRPRFGGFHTNVLCKYRRAGRED